jgi:ribonuclease R
MIYDSVNKRYISAAGLTEATLQVTARGIGFAVVGGGHDDIFIGRDGLNNAVDGDRILVSIKKGGMGRKEGVVSQILERRVKNIVGTVIQSKTTVFIIPDDERFGQSLEVRLTKGQKSGSGWRSGDKVVARFDEDFKSGKVYITEVLGEASRVGVDILSIIRQYNLYEEFPQATVAEARKVAVAPTETEVKRRVDLRERNIITIDPEDAKDLDDGIHIERLGNGTFELGVHIADVAHYVTADSELDKEAFKRGTSVYFPDRVLPMLPRQLSNDICSLHPEVDRLALSVIMQVSGSGEVISHKIVESIINVKRRYNYSEVQAILDRGTDEMLKTASELTLLLEKGRRARGEVVFDVPEPKIILDEKTGKIKDVIAYPHLLSHRIIESFMVLCNEVVAKRFCDLGAPFVYRVHDKPDPMKVAKFVETLKPFAVEHKINPEYPTGHAYSGMLLQLAKEIKPIVSSLALRSMQKAKYMETNIGHFGLGAKFYCHFTSPIRRYPDLVIHRIIKMMINGKLSSHKINELKEFVCLASEQSSKTELSATEAEREVDNLKRAEFMYDKIGETFEGHISGIQEFGVFVYLPNTVEGLIKIDGMPPDKYTYNEKQMLLVGTKRTWRMGDKIKVIVAGVSIARRQVEFRAVVE